MTEGPVLQNESADKTRGYAEHSHEYVTDGEVDDEKICYGLHTGTAVDDIADQTIAQQCDDKYRRVQAVDRRLEPGCRESASGR